MDGRRARAFAHCCAPVLLDPSAAPDPEALMRSRYTAFVWEDRDHLLATWHPSTRPAELNFDAGAKWLGLEVRHAATPSPDAGEVEFVARCRVQGRASRLHERSRFVRENGRWYYVNGDLS